MKFNTSMPPTLKKHFDFEFNVYRNSYRKGDLSTAWAHLERAHIIGQAYPFEHTYVHWEMLKFGFRIKSHKEIMGQIPRLLCGGIKSFAGKIPIGNTGGSNVPPLRSLPISDDLLALFKDAGIKK